MADKVNKKNNSENYTFLLNCLIATSSALLLVACALTYCAAKAAANQHTLIAAAASGSPLGLVAAFIGAALLLPYLFNSSCSYNTPYFYNIFSPRRSYVGSYAHSHGHPSTGFGHSHGHPSSTGFGLGHTHGHS